MRRWKCLSFESGTIFKAEKLQAYQFVIDLIKKTIKKTNASGFILTIDA